MSIAKAQQVKTSESSIDAVSSEVFIGFLGLPKWSWISHRFAQRSLINVR